MWESLFQRIRRVFAFTKKYTNVYFMTNEPTLHACKHDFLSLNRGFSIMSYYFGVLATIFDKFWQHQDMIYDFQAELHGTGSRSLHSSLKLCYYSVN